MTAARLPPLSLSMQFALARAPRVRGVDAAVHRAALPRHQVRRWIRQALEAEAQITLRIVDEPEGCALNRDYRQRDYATNVLTFGYGQSPLQADLVLCAPVVAREAQELGRDLRFHYAHLIVHGALHAQGWDHETSSTDADAMEARERQVLAALGFGDPYP